MRTYLAGSPGGGDCSDGETMRVYLAGNNGNPESCLDAELLKRLEELPMIRRLLSYHYHVKCNHENKHGSCVLDFYYALQDAGAPIDLFMDSGAFSAHTAGATIDLDEYCDWLLEHGHHFSVYAPLDVIGDPVASEKNLHHMENRGVKPVPVFHHGSDYSILRDLAQHYDYIALGGMVGKHKKHLQGHLDKCFSIVRDSARMHGLGYTSMDGLKRYPFYSVDSSSWVDGSRRGVVYKWEGNDLKKYHHKSKEDVQALGSLEFTESVGEKSRWMARVANNIGAWSQAEAYVTELWKRRGIDWPAWEAKRGIVAKTA